MFFCFFYVLNLKDSPLVVISWLFAMPFKPPLPLCVSGFRTTKHRRRCKYPLQITALILQSSACLSVFDSTSAFTPLQQFVCRYLQFPPQIMISLIICSVCYLRCSRQTDAQEIKIVELMCIY